MLRSRISVRRSSSPTRPATSLPTQPPTPPTPLPTRLPSGASDMAVTLNWVGTTGYDIFVNIWQSNNYSSYHYDPALDVGHSRIYQMEKGPGAGAITQVTGEPLSYQGAGTVGVNGPPIGNILAFCRDYYLPNRL